MAEAGQTFLMHFESQLMQPSGGVTTSVSWRVLAPIAEYTMSLHHLVQRILCLQALYTIALNFDPHIWLFPDEASGTGFAYASVLHQLEKVSERMQQMLSELKMRDLNIDGLPIPLNIVETTEVQAALFKLEPPLGHSDNDMLVQFCRGVQDSILRNFYAEQWDAISAELTALRVSWDNVMHYVLGDNYKSLPRD
ncbi:hypothetical protein EWM64_g2017 [Hericium alpestre]|uniref:Uncharacterized protein n=1 Tax=Hericium alpestre TaxID=135208 RepID=A0A4Z0A8S0_9AGAM|nr:hypothetical protein EWM64_g2017 [Hericium alpestre]